VDPQALGDALASVNALLNLMSACLLITGFVFVKRGRIQEHKRAMLGAVSASALFLVFYVTRFYLSGTHEFAGQGVARTIYLSILFSHMVLAVVVVPLVLRLLFLAHHERFEAHKKLARWTFPVWLYVSLTGLTVYLMLYEVYGYV